VTGVVVWSSLSDVQAMPSPCPRVSELVRLTPWLTHFLHSKHSNHIRHYDKRNRADIKRPSYPTLILTYISRFLLSFLTTESLFSFSYFLTKLVILSFFYTNFYGMLHFSTLLLSFSVVGIVSAAPAQFNKRVDQQTIASVQVWEGLCVSFHRSYNFTIQLILCLLLEQGRRRR
jgi:hypothetical protein